MLVSLRMNLGGLIIGALVGLFIALAVYWFLLAAVPGFMRSAFAHDSWISKGGHKNGAGEWCCGEGDCFAVPSEQVSVSGSGYRLYGLETVPFNEAQPSPDGVYWRCKRPDGSRRCFFAPPPSY